MMAFNYWYPIISFTVIALRQDISRVTVSLKVLLTPFLLDSRDGCCAPMKRRTVQRDLLPPPCSFSSVNAHIARSWMRGSGALIGIKKEIIVMKRHWNFVLGYCVVPIDGNYLRFDNLNGK